MVNEELTKKLAELSKIRFTDRELEIMAEEMVNIIGLVDKVKEFDSREEKFRTDTCAYEDLREDEIRESFRTEEITGNAVRVKEDSFVVPKVV